MIQIVYSIQDRLVGFGTPMYLSEDGFPDEIAKRMVKESLASVPREQIMVKLPDLDLVKLGKFDTVTGKFKNEEVPVVISSCAALLRFPELTKSFGSDDESDDFKGEDDEVY